MAEPHVESRVNGGDMDDYSRRGLATRWQPGGGREAVSRPAVTVLSPARPRLTGPDNRNSGQPGCSGDLIPTLEPNSRAPAVEREVGPANCGVALQHQRLR